MESLAIDAGARIELRDGWNVAVSYPAASFGESVSWCDTSHLPSCSCRASDRSLPFGTAVRRRRRLVVSADGRRALVVGARPELPEDLEVVDVTSVFASLTIAGPLARECFARFCALDLRPSVTPVGACVRARSPANQGR